MSGIRISCPGCGQELEAPEELAGQMVECPSCQQAMTVPAAAPAEAAAPENVSFSMPGLEDAAAAGAKSCPECGAAMEADAILCVNCGFHTGLGKKMTTDLS